MTMQDCIRDAIAEGSMDAARGKKASDFWSAKADEYERYGHPRHVAEAMASEDTKKAMRKQAGDDRHVALATMATMRRMQAEVEKTKKPDMRATMERTDYRQRALVRQFNGRLGAFLKEHHRDLKGDITKPAQLMNVVKEMEGYPSGDATAKILADGIREALEDMRLMANEAGAIIPKLENWFPHDHNGAAMRKAGYDEWVKEFGPRVDWKRTINNATSEPFQVEGGPVPDLATQEAFFQSTYKNNVFGRDVETPVYGGSQGAAMYRRHAEHRIVAFKTTEDWIAYNRRFGTGDPFKTLMSHVHSMARDIALMREFGPNPKLGAEYRGALWRAKLGETGNESVFDKLRGDVGHGLRMFNVLNGGQRPEGPWQEFFAPFMSSIRSILSSAMLDRAIIASMSDINTMRLAAESIGMNPGNIIAKQLGMMQSLSKDELLRAGWIADTMADPGTVLARFQSEIAPSEIAERLSNAAMRVQGLSAWTDRARAIFYQEFGGLYASQAGKKIDMVDEPLKSLLQKHGVTDDDWAAFTSDMFRADNGATFALPLYWRQMTDLPRKEADAIFDKMQGLLEEQMEIAVPTGSLLARGIFDPAAYNLPPGSIGYEIMKSGGMFKSFAMTFAVSQYRQIMSQPTIPGRVGYAMNLAAGATVMGALSLQIGDMLMGRDPQDMTDPMFWARAGMKGGAFSVIGDLFSAGETSWGGGFGSYVTGPIPQVAQDVWGLTIGNALELAAGEDTKFAEEFARFGKRYTPMGQTPAVGPAIDRLFWDQMQLWIDPDSADALAKASKKRTKTTGAGEFWLPGSPTPSRMPNVATAIGG